MELVVEVVEEEATQAAEDLSDAFEDIGGTIVVTDNAIVEIGAPVSAEVDELIPEESLAVSLTALEVKDVEAGAVITSLHGGLQAALLQGFPDGNAYSYSQRTPT